MRHLLIPIEDIRFRGLGRFKESFVDERLVTPIGSSVSSKDMFRGLFVTFAKTLSIDDLGWVFVVSIRATLSRKLFFLEFSPETASDDALRVHFSENGSESPFSEVGDTHLWSNLFVAL